MTLKTNYINNNWEKHDLLCEIDISFLLEICNPNPLPEYELQNRERVTPETLLKDIEKNGMQEPFFITYSNEQNTIRLESGNHRIHLLKKCGVEKVECVCFINKSGIMFEGNGLHTFKHKNIKDDINIKTLKITHIKNYIYQGIAINPKEIIILSDC